MSGYNGYSKSNRACWAEEEGRFPLTEAIKRLAKALGIPQKDARATLEYYGTGEWHHTGSWYNRTDYYDVAALMEDINNGEKTIINAVKKAAQNRFTDVLPVTYIEWGGTRNHPKRLEYTIDARLEYKGGVFVTIHPVNGQKPFRKKAENLSVNGDTLYDWRLADLLEEVAA